MAPLRILAFLALIGVCRNQTSDCSYKALLEHLNLTTNNRALQITRPVKNWTSSTLVQLKMSLYGILDVDEKAQSVVFHISINMFWLNEFLRWNSSEFCGIDSLTLPRSALWIPDVSIHEDASDSGSVLEDPLVHLSPSGLVLANLRQRLTFTCQLKLYRFPFDRQRCSITLSSMCCQDDYIKVGTFQNSTTFSNLPDESKIKEGEWRLVAMESAEFTILQRNSTKSILRYTVTFQRKPFLYIINFIVPLLFLLFLDVGSFFISEARGEKLSFKVTVLLSIFVILLILKDILPSTEDYLPIMASYCVSVFSLVWVSVLEAMLVNFLVDLDSESSGDGEVDLQQESDLPPAGPGDQNLLKRILDQLKAAGRNKDQRKPGCYRRLAKIIDVVFFLLYCAVIITSQISMFSLWVTEAD
ncbi:5-hydroxytryptamine receptor 3A-like [Cololabis saira]|uniref:5-hydroxytryptamine receptor 3A-like n=1 Tax=Cololabis saira TaxID=129043 RepID=UPI002AD3D0B1|nr:5-hydroxytryptamine receptor 3A-like [Cololabis saira]